MRRIATVALLFAVSIGCSLRSPAKRFRTQEEAGTVHVAVQSIARFDDAYTDELQPHFDLNAKDALNAISQTQVSEMERFRALLAELKVAGPEKPTEKSESVEPNDIRLPKPEDLTNKAPEVIREAIGLDQSLRYRTAAALLQEIALFNRYVRDAAVSRGSIPYVVRLLVTVNPSARREPYDIYTTISFFAHGKPDYSTGSEKSPRGDSMERAIDAINKELERTAQQDKEWDKGPSICELPVEIIPLFVTDNLESSLNSVANERVIDASGGASGWFASLAAVFGFRGRAVDRDRSMARSLNGLTTISRLGTNTVLARLGAAQANNQFEMVARTYNVTLLALVPTRGRLLNRYKTETWTSDSEEEEYVLQSTTPCREFSFTAYSAFRDAVSGTELPTRYDASRDQTAKRIVKTWGFNPALAPPVVLRLLAFAELGRYDRFREEVAKNLNALGPQPLDDLALQNTLWHDLVAQNDDSGRSYGSFGLPEPTTAFFTKSPVTLFDDGKTTTVVLNGGRNVSVDGLHAQIIATTDHDTFTFDETSVEISADRRRATFTFPSLQSRLPEEKRKFSRITFRASKIESGARGAALTTASVEPPAIYVFNKAEPVSPPARE